MEIQLTFAVLVAVITGLVQAVKVAGLPTRFAPLLAIALGISAAFLMKTDVLSGVVAALTSAGLFSGVKATLR